jgi:hypothetical protein
MTMHLFGYEQSVSLAALTAITPIPDGTVIVSGNDVRVPTQLPNLCFAAGMINSAAATLRAQMQSPLLRSVLNFDIPGLTNGLIFGNLPVAARMWNTPLPLAPLEGLNAFIQNGAAVMNRVFASFCDGPIKPVTQGQIFTVRATAAASLTTATWVNASLTFGQVLPAGHYQCVGARSWSANGCAFRFFPNGGFWRPGALMVNTEVQDSWLDFRYGNTGVWFEFDNTTPPTVDFMGITDTAQVVFLDLIKTK